MHNGLFTFITIANLPKFLQYMQLNGFRALVVTRPFLAATETQTAGTPVVTKGVKPVVDATAPMFNRSRHSRCQLLQSLLARWWWRQWHRSTHRRLGERERLEPTNITPAAWVHQFLL
jgi:hypothetical protein